MNQNVIKLQEVLVSKGLWSTQEIEKISLRRPIISDLFGLDWTKPENKHKNMCALISRLSGISTDLIEKMDLNDFVTVSNRVNNLMGPTI